MKFSWEAIVNGSSTTVDFVTDGQNFASKKTLFILVVYTLINFALIVTAFMAFCEFLFYFCFGGKNCGKI
jgi:hypothetical protein